MIDFEEPGCKSRRWGIGISNDDVDILERGGGISFARAKTDKNNQDSSER